MKYPFFICKEDLKARMERDSTSDYQTALAHTPEILEFYARQRKLEEQGNIVAEKMLLNRDIDGDWILRSVVYNFAMFNCDGGLGKIPPYNTTDPQGVCGLFAYLVAISPVENGFHRVKLAFETSVDDIFTIQEDLIVDLVELPHWADLRLNMVDVQHLTLLRSTLLDVTGADPITLN